MDVDGDQGGWRLWGERGGAVVEGSELKGREEARPQVGRRAGGKVERSAAHFMGFGIEVKGGDQTLRVWQPTCARFTGEEVLSQVCAL
jgi:hypothetical protein